MIEMCFPAAPCAPNIVSWPTNAVGGVTQAPKYDYEYELMCEPAPSTARVMVVTSKLETAGPGVTPTVTAYAFPAMTPYAGSLASLIQCGGADYELVQTCYQNAAGARFTRVDFVDTSVAPPAVASTLWRDAAGAIVAAPAGVVPCTDLESDAIQGCAGGVPVTQWVQKDVRGIPTGFVTYTSVAGAVIATPAGWAPGPCPVATPVFNPTGGGAQIAGPLRLATPAFAGANSSWNTGSVPDALHSFTVDAKGVSDGLPGQTANQIVLDMPDGTTIALLNGETRTFSVVRDQDAQLRRDYRVTASGNAYANITYTFA